MVWPPAEMPSVTSYTLLPKRSASSKSGASLNASLPFEEVNSNSSLSAPSSGSQAMVALSGSMTVYVPTKVAPPSSMETSSGPVMTGGSFTGRTATVTAMRPVRGVGALSVACTVML